MKYLTASFLALSSLLHLSAATPKATLMVEGLDRPVFMTAPVEDEDTFYIVEKDGVIRAFDRRSQKLLNQPFLDISRRIKIKSNEQGLLGMAFSPNYAKDRRFYLYFTDSKGDTNVSRFTKAANAELTASSEEILLTQKQDFRNHNGGWIGFGPDSMLYIGLGDGGSANDPKMRSQDLTSYLGKLLRIDVSPAKGYKVPRDNPFVNSNTAKPEIISYGLRNPWRCSWEGDDLVIADVGQNAWEEINVVPRKKLFGANFGWPQFEGTHATKNPKVKVKNPGVKIDPVYEYRHGSGSSEGFSITGGAVYKGRNLRLKNHYFFADYVKPNIWSAELRRGKLGKIKNHTKMLSQKGKGIRNISAITRCSQGELYIISHTGQIYKIS